MIGRREILKSLAAWPILSRVRGWGTPGGSAVGISDASTYYHRGFARLANLTRSEQELVANWKSIPIDRAVDSLLHRFRPALADLRTGAKTSRCEWAEVVRVSDLGTGHHAARSLWLGKIALLRARKLAEAGRGIEALDDVFAAASFGRHIGNGGILISRISQLAMENNSIAILAAILPRLGVLPLSTIPTRVASLPPPCSWAETMRLEGRFIAATVVAKTEAMGNLLTLDDLTDLGLDEASSRTVFELTGGNRGRVDELARDVVPLLASLAEVLKLPHELFGNALEAFRVRPEGINPFGDSVVGWADTARFASDRTEVLWTMILAARTRLVDGLESFRSIPDPFGAGPFGLVEFVGGFEVRSALSREGKPPAIVRVGSLPG